LTEGRSPSSSLLRFSAEQMLGSSTAMPFGGSFLPLETIRGREERAAAASRRHSIP